MSENSNHNIEKNQETLKYKSVDEIEDIVMQMMGSDGLSARIASRLISQIAQIGEISRAIALSELLHEELVKRGDVNGLLETLITETKWRTDEVSFRNVCKKSLIAVTRNLLLQNFVESSGFDSELPPAECLRRMMTLMLLKPGTCCIDNTWGTGIVQKIDELRRKVIIDFDNKREHEMSFAYAGETLQIPGQDDLRTMLRLEPDRVREMGLNQPAELVKLALKNCGPLTKSKLKELFVGKIFSEEEWQTFWEKARAELKKDPFVELPARTAEPLRLLAKPVEQRDVIANKLDRNIADSEVLEIIHQIFSLPSAERSGTLEQKAVDKFLEVLRKLKIQDKPELIARTLIISKQLMAYTGKAEKESLQLLARSLLEHERLISALNGTPSREIPVLLELLKEYTEGNVTENLFSALSELKPSVFDEVIDFLLRTGEKEKCVENFRKFIAGKTVPSVVVLWMCRNCDSELTREALQGGNVLDAMFDALGQRVTGEKLKIQKAIKKLLEDSSFIEQVLATTDEEKCKQIFRRLMHLTGIDDITKRTIMGLMIKSKPELNRFLQTDTEESAKGTPARVTSWRSYKKRYAQYRELVEIQIPRNSKDIDAARSYGDLSENFEYHAALEQQKLLLRRRDELAQDLHAVKGTDFRDVPADRVRPGTTVVVANSKGEGHRITILGEWDSDEKLGIVSSESPVAKSMAGHKKGDEVVIPAETGEERYRIIEILPLSEEIRKWIESD